MADWQEGSSRPATLITTDSFESATNIFLRQLTPYGQGADRKQILDPGIINLDIEQDDVTDSMTSYNRDRIIVFLSCVYGRYFTVSTGQGAVKIIS